MDDLIAQALAELGQGAKPEPILRRLAEQAADLAVHELLGPEELAARLGVSDRHIRKMATQFGIGIRLERGWLFRPDDVAKMQAARRKPGPRPKTEYEEVQ